MTGKVVKDFATFTLTPNQLGRNWAPPRRWSIALDDGTLVFADDQNLSKVPPEASAPPDTGKIDLTETPDANHPCAPARK